MNYPLYNGLQTPMITPPQVMPPPLSYSGGNDSGGNIWVQGLAGAKAYLVAPGRSATLWDSESQTIYLKSADASGMPTMKILDYVFRNDKNESLEAFKTDSNKYVLLDDFNVLKRELEDLREQIKHTPRQRNNNKGASKL